MEGTLPRTALALGLAAALISGGCGDDPSPPPGAFDLLAPADGATGVSVMPLLDWSDSSGAATYSLQVDDAPDFASPVISESALTESSHAVTTPLLDGVTYYWRVTAIGGTGSSLDNNSDFTFGVSRFVDIGAGLLGVSSSSLAWGDYDGDGDIDLAVAGSSLAGQANRIYRNDSGVFTNITAALSGVSNCSLAWGDYDNDGDLDLVLAGTDTSRIYRNDSGAFTDVAAGLMGVTRSAVSWGDYDNDGDLDLALAGYAFPANVSRIYRNDNGTFVDIDAGLLEANWSGVAWGDYDNDGDLDLALAGRENSDPTCRIYQNDSGVFTDVGAELTGVDKCSLAWGDYDNDGDLDLALAGRISLIPETGVSKIFRNDGGSFTDIDAGLTGVFDGSIAWGDYDNDGDIDLVLSGTSSGGSVCKVYRNDNGTFADTGMALPGLEECSVAWGDYNNDGHLDLAVTGNDISRIYRNTGGTPNTAPDSPTGLGDITNGCVGVLSWTPATDAETSSGGLSYNLRIGTSPGSDDVFAGMADTTSGFRTLPAIGNAQKKSSWRVYLSGGTYYWSVQAVDAGFVGSAWATERTFEITGPAVTLTRPNGSEYLEAETTHMIAWTSAGMTQAKLELSRNGGTDWEIIVASTPASAGSYPWIVTAPPSDNCIIRISDASAPATFDVSDSALTILPFADINAGLHAMNVCSLAWGDYDGDGDLDLALAGSGLGGPTSRIYRNDAGSFTDIDAGLTGASAGTLAWGDYDNDGDLDLFLAGSTAVFPAVHESIIYRNDAGTFTNISAGLPGVVYCSVAWGDYDNDGDLDLALTGQNAGGPISKIYRNTDGAFAEISAGLTGVEDCAVAWGDYDGDGDLDLALAGDTGGGYVSSIYRNDDGTFTDIDAGLVGVGYECSLAWGDYDNDGDLDLALAGLLTGRVAKIYRNDSGSFVDIAAGLAGTYKGSIAWGDYDNDGDLDLVVSGISNDGIICKVYRNDSGSFIEIDARLPGLFVDALAWGDYDNDGDLDLAIAGNSRNGNLSRIYRNDSGTVNALPDAPTGLSTSFVGAGPYDVTFTWTTAAAIDETSDDGLSYNLRVGTTPGGNEIFSGQADSATGKRRIPARGIIQPGASWNEWTLTLPAGTYYWSVQAVDAAFEGGAWTAEETVAVP
jgi:uncharacterized membrane protein YeaQ/YmgE (transglycosylase-associated protein family)